MLQGHIYTDPELSTFFSPMWTSIYRQIIATVGRPAYLYEYEDDYHVVAVPVNDHKSTLYFGTGTGITVFDDVWGAYYHPDSEIEVDRPDMAVQSIIPADCHDPQIIATWIRGVAAGYDFPPPI